MIFVVSNTANENRKQTYCWGLSTAEQRNGQKISTYNLAIIFLYMRDAEKSIRKNYAKLI